MQGMRSLKHSIMKPQLKKNSQKRNDNFYKSAWKAQFVSTLIYPTMRFINNLDYLAMAVIGGLKVISGTVNLGDVQAMLQYTNQFAQPNHKYLEYAQYHSGYSCVSRTNFLKY